MKKKYEILTITTGTIFSSAVKKWLGWYFWKLRSDLLLIGRLCRHSLEMKNCSPTALLKIHGVSDADSDIKQIKTIRKKYQDAIVLKTVEDIDEETCEANSKTNNITGLVGNFRLTNHYFER